MEQYTLRRAHKVHPISALQSEYSLWLENRKKKFWQLVENWGQEENLKKNLNIADTIVEFAEKKNCTPAQLAIAWVLSQGDNIVPIPGTRSIGKLKENMQAVNVTLSQTDLAELNQLIPIGVVAGEQYSEHYNFEV